MTKIFSFSIICVLVFQISYSQDNEKSNWHGKLKSGFSFYKGNVNKLSLKGGFDIANQDSVNEFSTYSNYDFSKVDSVVVKEEYSLGVKYDFLPFSIISPFTLLEVYRNKQKLIKIRYSGMLGAKYTAYLTKKADISLSIAAQYDNENRYIPEDATPDFELYKETVRMSLRPKFMFQLTDNIRFVHYTFYQPSPFDFNDYRIYSNTGISTKFYKKISLDLEYIYEYDNITVDKNVVKEDSSFFVTFSLAF